MRRTKQQEYWLNKIITKGYECGIYEYTIFANSKLSD